MSQHIILVLGSEKQLEGLDIVCIGLGVASVVGEIAGVGIAHAVLTCAVCLAFLFYLGIQIAAFAVAGFVQRP
jgi:hypothetical protein